VTLVVIFIRFRESFWVACTWWELAFRNKPKVNAAGFDELNIFEYAVPIEDALAETPCATFRS
jgi:hypothetical protein